MQNQKQVKRFVAPSMTRALDLVRQEMGPEAIILSSQRTKQGVEIVTSVEPDPATPGLEQRREFGRYFDDEFDTALPSDSAWKQQAGAEKAAEKYDAHLQVNSDKKIESRPKQTLNGENLAREIEKARERMLAAKRKASEEEQFGFAMRDEKQASAGVGRGPFYSGEEATDIAGVSKGKQPLPAATENREAFEKDFIANISSQAEEKLAGESLSSMSAEALALKNLAEQQLAAQQKIKEQQQFAAQKNMQDEALKNREDEEKLQGLQSEIADLRMLLEQQVWRMTDSYRSQDNFPGQLQLPANYAMLHQRLSRLGLSEDLAQDLMQSAGKFERVSDAWRACMFDLAKRVPVVSGDMINQGGVFAFVGPTGVGKTTTIAKLAARYVLQHGPGKVALITTDTYRVGAYDQLRSLGRILNMPVRAVDGEHTLLGLIASLRNFPLILIDTAGFRHGDPMLQDQLAKLDACQSIRRLLVMSCNSQVQSLVASTHAYASRQGIDACVLTKVDESASLGEAIGVVLKKQLPLAYTTDGQEIPKDVASGCGRRLVAAAVNIMKNGGQVEASVSGA